MHPFADKPQRVAAYCRVSTDQDDQANSLESQQRYFRQYIERNPFWELSEVYVDEGITGTSTKKRHAFNRMMADAQAGRFDLILTKEISRFARNTLDSILYTRRLKDWGVGVFFLNDNINTLDADAELRLTIMSSIAQEESRKTSDRVKWGQKRQMEQGVVFGRDMLGYDVKDGKLHVNEQGAETVCLIFHKFVREGKGTHVIARELREAGIPTSTHMKKWSNTVILRVLRNEKYCGDLIQKKTYTPSYLTHEKKLNRGEEEFVVLRDHHEPIVSRQLFEEAQAELARRSPTPEQKAKHSNRYAFSGKIKCGSCGCSFVSRSKKRKDGSVYKAWRCYEAAAHGSPHIDKAGNEVGCACVSLNDEDAKWLMQQVVQSLQMDREKIVRNLSEIIGRVIQSTPQEDKVKSLQGEQTQIAEKKQRLLDLYLGKGITMQEYQQMSTGCDAQIQALEEQIAACHRQAERNESRQEVLAIISATLQSLATGEEWDDAFYRHLLDEMVVNGGGEEEPSIDVHLSLLPHTWHFEAQSGNRHFDTSVSGQNATNANRIKPGGSDPHRHFDTSLPRGTAEMCQNGRQQNTPLSSNLMIHTIRSDEKIIRYSKNNIYQHNEEPTVAKSNRERIINLFIGTPETA